MSLLPDSPAAACLCECPYYLCYAVPALVVTHLALLCAAWVAARGQAGRRVKHYDRALVMLEEEQGEWYVGLVLERELARILKYYASRGDAAPGESASESASESTGESASESTGESTDGSTGGSADEITGESASEGAFESASGSHGGAGWPGSEAEESSEESAARGDRCRRTRERLARLRLACRRARARSRAGRPAPGFFSPPLALALALPAGPPPPATGASSA